MLDVLTVTPWFPNERDGWPTPFIASSALALARSGANVRVLVTRAWHPRFAERWVGQEHRGRIKVEAFPELDDIATVWRLAAAGDRFRGASNLVLDLTLSRAVRKAIETRRPDVMHVHTEGLAPAVVGVAKKAGVPCVVTIHGETTNTRFLFSPRQRRRFLDALGNASAVAIVGETLRSLATTLAGRGDHIVYTPNGVDPPPKRRIPPRPDDGPVEIVSVGNLQEGKGIDLSLEALGRLRARGVVDWRFSIIGGGPLHATLQQRAAELGIASQTRFLGVLPNDEVRRRLADADVFLLPSYREAFGVAYLEAMAAGLVTIGVEGQGPSQFIRHGATGYLAPPRDVDALVALLQPFFFQDRERWRAVAEAGRREVLETSSWDSHARGLLSIYDRLIDAAPKFGAGHSFED
jgi:glycosyltransferase involved in cell wall biosynthesis